MSAIAANKKSIDYESQAMGLLKVASRHKQTAEALNQSLSEAQKALVALAREMPSWEVAEKVLIAYVQKDIVWWHGDSSRLGVLTTIREYQCVKSDRVIKAHYSEYGHFIAVVSEKDPVPRPYKGNFIITLERFRFVMDRQAKSVADFFQPNEPVSAPVEPAPVRKVARPKRAKPVVQKAKWDDDE